MDERLKDLLHELCLAARQAIDYTDTISFEDFQIDVMRQQAVAKCFLIIGESAARLMADHSDFVAAHSDLPWQSMRGMRNRIAYAYFKLKLEYVWNAARHNLPMLTAAICRSEGDLAV
jgi:uncharacterized protein with HEPN domain